MLLALKGSQERMHEEVGWFAERGLWEGLRSFGGMVESVREVARQSRTEMRFFWAASGRTHDHLPERYADIGRLKNRCTGAWTCVLGRTNRASERATPQGIWRSCAT
jgi:hypothetical protein